MTPEHTYYPAERLFHGRVVRVMGTAFDLLLTDCSEDAGKAVWDRSCQILGRIARLADRFDPGSVLSALNMAAPGAVVETDEELCAMLGLCRSYFEQTEGYFDVSLGGGCRYSVSDCSVRIPEEGQKLDLGGFAKGYAVREIACAVRDAGIKNALIDLGSSSVMALGHHPFGDCWKISLPDPYFGHILREFSLRDTALSVSGNTPSYNGHILNPHTGTADTKVRISAVVTPDALDAEVMSTVWMIADTAALGRIRGRFEIIEDFRF